MIKFIKKLFCMSHDDVVYKPVDKKSVDKKEYKIFKNREGSVYISHIKSSMGRWEELTMLAIKTDSKDGKQKYKHVRYMAGAGGIFYSEMGLPYAKAMVVEESYEDMEGHIKKYHKELDDKDWTEVNG